MLPTSLYAIDYDGLDGPAGKRSGQGDSDLRGGSGVFEAPLTRSLFAPFGQRPRVYPLFDRYHKHHALKTVSWAWAATVEGSEMQLLNR